MRTTEKKNQEKFGIIKEQFEVGAAIFAPIGSYVNESYKKIEKLFFFQNWKQVQAYGQGNPHNIWTKSIQHSVYGRQTPMNPIYIYIYLQY